MKRQKTAVVTGAAGPLGTAILNKMVEEGIRVIAIDMKSDPLERIAGANPGTVIPCVCDITDQKMLDERLQPVLSRTGAPDILVNNAGILTNNKLQHTTEEEWERVMKVNLTAPFLLCKRLIPGMVGKGWGRVINISSLAAKSGGITAGLSYTVSKGGLLSLTFSLAAETAGSGVTVNAVAPAYVRTPMITEQLTEAEREMVRAKIPVHRFCEPEEVAALVLFLAGDEAGFITGEVIDQNGGLHFD